MRIFVSYSRDDGDVAERIALRLRGEGHHVFFDQDDLSTGQAYDADIRSAIATCDASVFLISPRSVRDGSYARSELRLIKERWRHPRGRVLPVEVFPTPLGDVPEYLKSVGILKPEGDAAAEVLSAIAAFNPASTRKLALLGANWFRALILAVAAAAIVRFCELSTESRVPVDPSPPRATFWFPPWIEGLEEPGSLFDESSALPRVGDDLQVDIPAPEEGRHVYSLKIIGSESPSIEPILGDGSMTYRMESEGTACVIVIASSAPIEIADLHQRIQSLGAPPRIPPNLHYFWDGLQYEVRKSPPSVARGSRHVDPGPANAMRVWADSLLERIVAAGNGVSMVGQTFLVEEL